MFARKGHGTVPLNVRLGKGEDRKEFFSSHNHISIVLYSSSLTSFSLAKQLQNRTFPSFWRRAGSGLNWLVDDVSVRGETLLVRILHAFLDGTELLAHVIPALFDLQGTGKPHVWFEVSVMTWWHSTANDWHEQHKALREVCQIGQEDVG